MYCKESASTIENRAPIKIIYLNEMAIIGIGARALMLPSVTHGNGYYNSNA